MPYQDLRQFIKCYEDNGELARIKDEVDWDLEIGAMTRRSFDLQWPALLLRRSRDTRVITDSSHAWFQPIADMHSRSISRLTHQSKK